MPDYQAIFVAVNELSETEVGPIYRLNATERGEAEDEAWQLPRPEGANFVKLVRDGQFEGPKIGFDL